MSTPAPHPKKKAPTGFAKFSKPQKQDIPQQGYVIPQGVEIVMEEEPLLQQNTRIIVPQIPQSITNIPANTKVCILLLTLAIVVISAILLVAVAFSSDHKHQRQNNLAISRIGELTFSLSEHEPITKDVITYYYDFILKNVVQEWQYIPSDTESLPFLNHSLNEVVSFNVCCKEYDPISGHTLLICSNGQTFDFFSFEARMTTLGDNGLQCIVYLNSAHLTSAKCTLELKVLSP